MSDHAGNPYICPYCKKEYPLPPKECSCQIVEIVEETNYYFLSEDPKDLDGSCSVQDMDAEEISEDEFRDPMREGYYVEETFSPGIETAGSFYRVIKKNKLHKSQ